MNLNNTENLSSIVAKDEMMSIIYIVSLCLLFAAFIFIAIMYIHNQMMKAKEAKTQRISIIFQELLYRYINIHLSNIENYESLDNITDRISNLISDDDNKIVFKKIIMSLSKLFEGKIKMKLEKLYFELGLFRLTMDKLESDNWQIKLGALNELKELRLEKSREILKKLIEDKDERVSISAMQSIMELDQDPFLFLTEHKRPLTKAQIIFIAKKASTMEVIHFKELLELFENPEDSIAKLGIQLASILHIREAVPNLKHFLSHQNEEVRAWAFISLAYLDAQTVFKELYQFSKTAHENTLGKIIQISNSQQIRVPKSVLTLVQNSIQMKKESLGSVHAN